MFLQIDKIPTTLRRIPFIVWLSIIQLFLLINAPLFAPVEQVENFRMALIVYLIAQLIFWKYRSRVHGANMQPGQAIYHFIAGAVLTIIIITALQGWDIGGPTYRADAWIHLIILHSLVVGLSETLIFQGFMPLIMTAVPAQVLFSAFHLSAYGMAWESLLIAFGAGIVFYITAKKVSIWFASGLHTGYNWAMLAVFVPLLQMLGIA